MSSRTHARNPHLPGTTYCRPTRGGVIAVRDNLVGAHDIPSCEVCAEAKEKAIREAMEWTGWAKDAAERYYWPHP